MKKYMDKLRKNIRINKNLFVFLLVIIIVGVLAGSLFTVILNQNDKELVTEYLTSFFNNAKEGKLNYDTSILNTLVFTVGLAFLIWLLGISVIGFFIVIFMLFLKAFILGFSLSSIIINFKLKGILLSTAYIFPHQIINIMIFLLLTAYSLMISYKIIMALTGKKTLDFKNIINRYLMILGITVLVLIITSLYEVYIVPKLISMIMTLIK